MCAIQCGQVYSQLTLPPGNPSPQNRSELTSSRMALFPPLGTKRYASSQLLAPVSGSVPAPIWKEFGSVGLYCTTQKTIHGEALSAILCSASAYQHVFHANTKMLCYVRKSYGNLAEAELFPEADGVLVVGDHLLFQGIRLEVEAAELARGGREVLQARVGRWKCK